MIRGLQIVGLLISLIIVITLLQPSREQDPKPWDIQLMPDGNSRVFNLHLDHSRLRDAQRQFNDLGEVAIFTEQGKQPVLESYFSSVNLAGLSAKVILTLDLSDTELTSMMSNSVKQSQQESGSIKYELIDKDENAVSSSLIKAIDYIPSVTVEKSTIEHRFGKAQEIQQLNESSSQVWLYPDINLKVFINEGNKTIFHYHSKQSS